MNELQPLILFFFSFHDVQRTQIICPSLSFRMSAMILILRLSLIEITVVDFTIEKKKLK